jgi:hypothetical protein
VLDKLLSAATTNVKLVLAAAAGAALVAGGSAVAINSVSDSSGVNEHTSEQGLSAAALQGENRSDTATARIGSPKPSKSPKADGEHPDNPGACVSAVAKTTPAAEAAPNAHGKLVSETAKSDCGKTDGSTTAETQQSSADKKADRVKTSDDTDADSEGAEDADDDGSGPSSTGTERSGGRAGRK